MNNIIYFISTTIFIVFMITRVNNVFLQVLALFSNDYFMMSFRNIVNSYTGDKEYMYRSLIVFIISFLFCSIFPSHKTNNMLILKLHLNVFKKYKYMFYLISLCVFSSIILSFKKSTIFKSSLTIAMINYLIMIPLIIAGSELCGNRKDTFFQRLQKDRLYFTERKSVLDQLKNISNDDKEEEVYDDEEEVYDDEEEVYDDEEEVYEYEYDDDEPECEIIINYKDTFSNLSDEERLIKLFDTKIKAIGERKQNNYEAYEEKINQNNIFLINSVNMFITWMFSSYIIYACIHLIINFNFS